MYLSKTNCSLLLGFYKRNSDLRCTQRSSNHSSRQAVQPATNPAPLMCPWLPLRIMVNPLNYITWQCIYCLPHSCVPLCLLANQPLYCVDAMSRSKKKLPTVIPAAMITRPIPVQFNKELLSDFVLNISMKKR